jgi:hypothetical protein
MAFLGSGFLINSTTTGNQATVAGPTSRTGQWISRYF